MRRSSFAAWLRGAIEAQDTGGDPAAAEAHYTAAIALAEELGARPLVAHCHLGLARLHGSAGKRESSKTHLVTATAMYREMGMAHWLEQAEALRVDP